MPCTQRRTLTIGALAAVSKLVAPAACHHPSVHQASGNVDEGFQGFGVSRSGRDGVTRLCGVKPVRYPGRTPHIHAKLRHASFGEVTSQLFIAGGSRQRPALAGAAGTGAAG